MAVTILRSLALVLTCESEARSEADKVANLGGGADRNTDEVQVVAFRTPGAALDEVRRNGDSTTADLALKTESLRDGETRRSAISVDDEVVRQYEGLETIRIRLIADLIGRVA